MKSQTDNESTHIIAVMREEKQMLMQKIHTYERESVDKGGLEKRLKEMEEQIGKMASEIQSMRSMSIQKDKEIEEY